MYGLATKVVQYFFELQFSKANNKHKRNIYCNNCTFTSELKVLYLNQACPVPWEGIELPGNTGSKAGSSNNEVNVRVRIE